jgi:hypothetical protein
MFALLSGMWCLVAPAVLYAWPMPTCDVVDCTSPATDTVPAPGVIGGRLYVCKSDMEKIASGTYTYVVHPEIQKLELRKKT